ncbi:ThiS family protein [Chloroflexota bacterium]
MSVKVIIPPVLKHTAHGMDVAEVNGSIVGECLNEFVMRFPDSKELLFDDTGTLFEHFEVYINGKSIYPDGLAKPIHDGDELYLLYIIIGG